MISRLTLWNLILWTYLNYIKIKLLIGDCGFYIIEIEGMYFDVIGRNLLKKLYHERNIILAQSNVL